VGGGLDGGWRVRARVLQGWRVSEAVAGEGSGELPLLRHARVASTNGVVDAEHACCPKNGVGTSIVSELVV
jgi:hypothetical protein